MNPSPATANVVPAGASAAAPPFVNDTAAVAFSRRVLSGDAHKRDQYLGFLASGSSKPPLETLRLAGVDMESPEPVEECLRSFEEALDEMERLMEEA